MNSDTKTLPKDDCVNHFDNKAANWSALYDRACFADRLNLFVSEAVENVVAGGHILDYGCGTGILARALNDVGFRVTGVDASEMMIAEARKSLTGDTLRPLAFRHIDSDVWPESAETYDAIVCSSVLEYIEDHELMLSKLSSRIDPGGTLLISVPNSKSLLGRLEDIYSRLASGPRDRQERDVDYCKRRYSAEEFTTQLDQVGMDATEVGYFEMPRIGRLGIALSRHKLAGVMMLVTGTKRR